MKSCFPLQRHRNKTATVASLVTVLICFAIPLPLTQADSSTDTGDPLASVRLALALRLEDDALRKIKNLPPPHAPDETVELALLKSSALVAKKQYNDAMDTLNQAIDNITPDTPGTTLLHYQKALLLAKQENFPQAHMALNNALAALPENHNLRPQILTTRLLLPPGEENHSAADQIAQITNLRDSLPEGRERDILGLALLTLPAPDTPVTNNQRKKLAEELTAHPDPSISATARYLSLQTHTTNKQTTQNLQQLEALIEDSATPTFIRSLSAAQSALIHIKQKEPDAARALAELAITSAETPSERAAALNIWWQTIRPRNDDTHQETHRLLEKIATTSGNHAAVQTALILAKKFRDVGQPQISADLLLHIIKLEPDVGRRIELLNLAVQQALHLPDTALLRQWLENPAHQALLPAHIQFWRTFLALRENDLARAQQLILTLPEDPHPEAPALSRLAHAALTLTEDPDAPLDTALLEDQPEQHHHHLLQWLQGLRLLAAAALNKETLSIDTAKELLANPSESNLSTIIASAKNALDNGHLSLCQKILETIPPPLRNQHWKLQSLLSQIADGKIPPASEPQAWNDLLPRLTRPDLIALARERLAAACWNIGNYSRALAEWSRLLDHPTLSPQRRADITYFAALAARRSGDPAKAADLLASLTADTNTTAAGATARLDPDPALICEAMLELARIGLENPALTQKAPELLQTLSTRNDCHPDTSAIAAILLAEHLLHERETGTLPDLEKITSLLTPLAADAQISKDLAFRAKILQGLALLRAGQTEQAEETFLDVVYGRLAPGAADASRPAEMYWFARAVLEAGTLLEARQAWAQAAALYRLAETTIPPESESWRARRQRIEREHLIFN